MFDATHPGPDYELIWPRALFVLEAAALLQRPLGSPSNRAELLLSEAFAGSVPVNDLKQARWDNLQQHLFPAASFKDAQENVERTFLSQLLGAVDVLPERYVRQPYWSTRQGGAVTIPGPSPTAEQRKKDLQRDWTRLVDDFINRGYLDHVARRSCADDPAPPQLELLDVQTEERLGVAGLWPLRSAEWDDDTFYSLIEVVHDLVARPRDRWWHDYLECGWHYSDFAVVPGQQFYRWQVDRLLARYDTELRLADEGEDAGRLVHAAGDERDELLHRVLDTPAPRDRAAAKHAIALFRGRAASREEKRSAVVALARILEDRRQLMKEKMQSKDEGALFQIANEFDLRHRVDKDEKKQQKSDYDEAFLDWIFWWYLGTVELTDRLLLRSNFNQESSPTAAHGGQPERTC